MSFEIIIMVKKYILVTGGAGFVGSNHKRLVKRENVYILSLDNYSSGKKIVYSRKM